MIHISTSVNLDALDLERYTHLNICVNKQSLQYYDMLKLKLFTSLNVRYHRCDE